MNLSWLYLCSRNTKHKRRDITELFVLVLSAAGNFQRDKENVTCVLATFTFTDSLAGSVSVWVSTSNWIGYFEFFAKGVILPGAYSFLPDTG